MSVRVKGRGYFQFFVRTATATDSGLVLHDQQLPSVPTTNRHVSLFPAPFGVDWLPISIVADVPVETDIVYYGITLMGGRALWIDDVRIATVDPGTRLTQERSIGGRRSCPSTPGPPSARRRISISRSRRAKTPAANRVGRRSFVSTANRDRQTKAFCSRRGGAKAASVTRLSGNTCGNVPRLASGSDNRGRPHGRQ